MRQKWEMFFSSSYRLKLQQHAKIRYNDESSYSAFGKVGAEGSNGE
jgi:hypothetical protein